MLPTYEIFASKILSQPVGPGLWQLGVLPESIGTSRTLFPPPLFLSLLFFSPCACARVAQNMTNDHRSSHRYTQEFKPRRTRVNLGAAERLSTLLWTPEADKWTNGGSENELFASR